MGAAILASVPAEVQQFVAPFIPAIVQGIHQAFSLAIADTMWIAMIATGIAGVATLGLKEVALRRTVGANSMAAKKPDADGIAVPVSASTKADAPTTKLPATE